LQSFSAVSPNFPPISHSFATFLFIFSQKNIVLNENWRCFLSKRFFIVCAGAVAGGVLARHLLGQSEEAAAQSLNSTEMDKAVTYMAVNTWKDVGAVLMRIVEAHNGDVASYDEFAFEEWFELVRALPYVPDQPTANVTIIQKVSAMNTVAFTIGKRL
jgi:hypothetical protein